MSTRDSDATRPLNCSVRTSGAVCTCTEAAAGGPPSVQPSTASTTTTVAAVHAIADLARAEQSEVVAAAYAGEKLAFGPEYLIPKPFDPRLMMKIAPAVAQAAADSGVALRPIADMDAYREKLQSFVLASGTLMKPIYAAAKLAEAKRWTRAWRGQL